MNDGFFVRLVPSESMIIKTANLASSLKKVSPKEVNGLSMEEGSSKFQLPGNLGEMGTNNVNAKVRSFLFLWRWLAYLWFENRAYKRSRFFLVPLFTLKTDWNN